jgi:hypothetical protein
VGGAPAGDASQGLLAAAGALQRAAAAHVEGCARAVSALGRPPPAALPPPTAPDTPPPLAAAAPPPADGLASISDVNFGNPAQRLIGASLLRTANRRIVLLERYPGEMGRVWRANGCNSAAPAVQEAMWRLSQHAPPADVLRATGELLRMEGTKKAAPGEPLVRDGRRYRHDDMTVRCAPPCLALARTPNPLVPLPCQAIVVLLPAYMAEENATNGGLLRFQGAPWPVASGVDTTAHPQLEELYSDPAGGAAAAQGWDLARGADLVARPALIPI